MKFRKLLVCLLIGIAMAGFANVYTYAAEENIVTEDSTVVNDNNDSIDDTANTDSSAVVEEITDTVSEDTAEAPAEEVKNNDAAKEQAADDKKAEAADKKAADEKKAADKKAAEAKKESEEEDYSQADLRLLSALIYCEANGESYNGKLAVAIVVMNRVRSGSFPDSVKGVIYQKYQFGPVTNGTLSNALEEYDNDKFNSDAEKECVKAAKEALSGVTAITVNGSKKSFSKYLYFSGSLRGNTFTLGNHEFK